MQIEGFESSGKFYDDKNFPRGFGKSGEFTIAEAGVLHQYGKTLQALERGQRQPSSPNEKHFVAVCLGKKEATSLLERSWLKYKAVISRRLTVSAFGTPGADDEDTVEEDDLEVMDDLDDVDDE